MQASAFHNEEIQRVSEQHLSQVVRVAGYPERENIGGLNSSCSSTRRFYFRAMTPSEE